MIVLQVGKIEQCENIPNNFFPAGCYVEEAYKKIAIFDQYLVLFRKQYMIWPLAIVTVENE